MECGTVRRRPDVIAVVLPAYPSCFVLCPMMTPAQWVQIVCVSVAARVERHDMVEVAEYCWNGAVRKGAAPVASDDEARQCGGRPVPDGIWWRRPFQLPECVDRICRAGSSTAFVRAGESRDQLSSCAGADRAVPVEIGRYIVLALSVRAVTVSPSGLGRPW